MAYGRFGLVTTIRLDLTVRPLDRSGRSRILGRHELIQQLSSKCSSQIFCHYALTCILSPPYANHTQMLRLYPAQPWPQCLPHFSRRYADLQRTMSQTPALSRSCEVRCPSLKVLVALMGRVAVVSHGSDWSFRARQAVEACSNPISAKMWSFSEPNSLEITFSPV